MYTEEKILNIIKSGDFTIVYWDRGIASLYEKKWNKSDEYTRDDYGTMNKFLMKECEHEDGYLPEIVELLTKALNGVSDSI